MNVLVRGVDNAALESSTLLHKRMAARRELTPIRPPPAWRKSSQHRHYLIQSAQIGLTTNGTSPLASERWNGGGVISNGPTTPNDPSRSTKVLVSYL